MPFENGETLSANDHLNSNTPEELEIVRRQLGNNSIRHMIRTSLVGFGWSMVDDAPATCWPFLTCRSSFLASLVECLSAMTKEADCGGRRVDHRYVQTHSAMWSVSALATTFADAPRFRSELQSGKMVYGVKVGLRKQERWHAAKT